jgi:hypothetical protein
LCPHVTLHVSIPSKFHSRTEVTFAMVRVLP